MLRSLYLPILVAVLTCGGFTVTAQTASAQGCCGHCFPGQACVCSDIGYMKPIHRAQYYNWNRNYAYTDYGLPTALIVPPTAQLQTNYGWGVASSRISRIDHQFQRNYPGNSQFGGPFRPTPVWPSDTTQFGVYPVRGPW
jgi:hypothetical protein